MRSRLTVSRSGQSASGSAGQRTRGRDSGATARTCGARTRPSRSSPTTEPRPGPTPCKNPGEVVDSEIAGPAPTNLDFRGKVEKGTYHLAPLGGCYEPARARAAAPERDPGCA